MADGAPNQLDIFIKLVADLAGGKLTEEQLALLKQGFDRLGQSRGPGEAASSLEGLNSVLGSLMPSLARVGSMAGIVTILSDFVKEANSAFTDWESRLVSINAVLANGEQLTAANSSKVEELANKFQDRLNINAEKWLEVSSRLLASGKVQVANLEDQSKVVENLAGLIYPRFNDAQEALSTASLLYSRALVGSTQMLTRYGIVVDENASLEEKLAEIQQQAARGMGVLAAQAEINVGVHRRFADEVQHLLRNFGDLPQITGIISGLADVVHHLAVQFPEATTGANGLVNKLDALATSAGNAGDAGAAMGTAMADGIAKVSKAADALLKQLDQLQKTQDQLNDADMAASIEEAKLAGENKKLKLGAGDTEGREAIDFDTEKTVAGIRLASEKKKLDSDRDIAERKKAVIEQPLQADQKFVEDADQKHAQALANLVPVLMRLGKDSGRDYLGLIGNLDKLFETLTKDAAVVPAGTFANSDYYTQNIGKAPGLVSDLRRAQNAAISGRVTLASDNDATKPALADLDLALQTNAVQLREFVAKFGEQMAAFQDKFRVKDFAEKTKDAIDAAEGIIKDPASTAQEKYEARLDKLYLQEQGQSSGKIRLLESDFDADSHREDTKEQKAETAKAMLDMTAEQRLHHQALMEALRQHTAEIRANRRELEGLKTEHANTVSRLDVGRIYNH